METKLILIALTALSLSSRVSGQSQADCSNLYLDTVTFYLAPQQDTAVTGNLFYMDGTMTFYPVLHLILSDTSIITSANKMFLSFLDSGDVHPFVFAINFKTTAFSNNTQVNGLFHIYDSDTPGDSIVTCYFPITIILQKPTGINESSMHKRFCVYPNPTEKSATLKFENTQNENCTFMLYNVHGQLVQTITDITTNNVKISGENFVGGLYVFKLFTDQAVIASGKLMIK